MKWQCIKMIVPCHKERSLNGKAFHSMQQGGTAGLSVWLSFFSQQYHYSLILGSHHHCVFTRTLLNHHKRKPIRRFLKNPILAEQQRETATQIIAISLKLYNLDSSFIIFNLFGNHTLNWWSILIQVTNSNIFIPVWKLI